MIQQSTEAQLNVGRASQYSEARGMASSHLYTPGPSSFLGLASLSTSGPVWLERTLKTGVSSAHSAFMVPDRAERHLACCPPCSLSGGFQFLQVGLVPELALGTRCCWRVLPDQTWAREAAGLGREEGQPAIRSQQPRSVNPRLCAALRVG